MLPLSLLRRALAALEIEPYGLRHPWSVAQFRERAMAREALRDALETLELIERRRAAFARSEGW